MKHFARRCALPLVLAALLPAVQWRDERPDVKLPSGKSQREEILKAEHAKALREAAELAGLAESLKQELEKTGHSVLSVSSLRKTEEIEKLAKRIRSRLRRN
jgi:hypothetical protein